MTAEAAQALYKVYLASCSATTDAGGVGGVEGPASAEHSASSTPAPVRTSAPGTAAKADAEAFKTPGPSKVEARPAATPAPAPVATPTPAARLAEARPVAKPTASPAATPTPAASIQPRSFLIRSFFGLSETPAPGSGFKREREGPAPLATPATPAGPSAAVDVDASGAVPAAKRKRASPGLASAAAPVVLLADESPSPQLPAAALSSHEDEVVEVANIRLGGHRVSSTLRAALAASIPKSGVEGAS
jgi:hypothetical protein